MKANIGVINATTDSPIYTVDIVEVSGEELDIRPCYPYKNWKTRKGAERWAIKNGMDLMSDDELNALRRTHRYAFN